MSVSVSCGATEMTAKVTSLALFQGRVYARDRPTTCSVDVHNATEFHLPIQLTGSECATKLVVRYGTNKQQRKTITLKLHF